MRGRPVLLLGWCAGIAASWSGGCSSSPEDCGYCDSAGWATGPQIVTRYSTIAAIETVAPCGSTTDPCGVKSTGADRQLWPGDSISPIPTIDAGWATELCARRYACPQPPPPSWIDASIPFGEPVLCGSAWLDVRADHCLATVISTAGERQSFEVTRATGACESFPCRTETGACTTRTFCASAISPSSITVSFAPPCDAGTSDAPSSGE